MQSLTIATRGSRLALWQAEHVAERIRNATLATHPGLSIEMLVVKTRGDAILDKPLAEVGGKGLFVKEIEEALLDGRADIAVHSMKDMPMELAEGLMLAAVPEREDPADMMLSVMYRGPSVLPSGSTVGTSSLRRQAQLLSVRPDIRVEPLRGNIDTRLRRLQEGQFDAIILASAGISRLGLKAPYMERIAPDRMLPSAGQGALGLEIRADNSELAAVLARLEHAPTRLCVEAERGFLAGLQGDCRVPVGAYATLDADGSLHLDGMVAQTDGSAIVRRNATGDAGLSPDQARELGLALAAEVFENGGRSVLNTVLYGTTAQES